MTDDATLIYFTVEVCSCIYFVFSVSYQHSQLFGEDDADQDVSPDMADPEAACE